MLEWILMVLLSLFGAQEPVDSTDPADIMLEARRTYRSANNCVPVAKHISSRLNKQKQGRRRRLRLTIERKQHLSLMSLTP